METGTGISDGTARATGPAPAPDPRPLRLVLAANVVSISGNSLTLIGVPWFVLETTGSAGRAGLVAFCATLPVVVSALDRRAGHRPDRPPPGRRRLGHGVRASPSPRSRCCTTRACSSSGCCAR